MFGKIKKLNKRIDELNDNVNNHDSSYWEEFKEIENMIDARFLKLKYPKGYIEQHVCKNDTYHTTSFQFIKNDKIKNIDFNEKEIKLYKIKVTDNIAYIEIRLINNSDVYYIANLQNESIIKIDSDISNQFNDIEWTMIK